NPCIDSLDGVGEALVLDRVGKFPWGQPQEVAHIVDDKRRPTKVAGVFEYELHVASRGECVHGRADVRHLGVDKGSQLRAGQGSAVNRGIDLGKIDADSIQVDQGDTAVGNSTGQRGDGA